MSCPRISCQTHPPSAAGLARLFETHCMSGVPALAIAKDQNLGRPQRTAQPRSPPAA